MSFAILDASWRSRRLVDDFKTKMVLEVWEKFLTKGFYAVSKFKSDKNSKIQNGWRIVSNFSF